MSHYQQESWSSTTLPGHVSSEIVDSALFTYEAKKQWEDFGLDDQGFDYYLSSGGAEGRLNNVYMLSRQIVPKVVEYMPDAA